MVNLIFLGTGDQIPSLKRNHSAVLLNYEGENILFDCGEGTQRQFRKARLNPGKVTRICISHWHGDHVLGIIGLISTLSSSGHNKPLYIYGPTGTREKFHKFLELFPFQKNYSIFVEEVEGKFFENEFFYLEAEKMDHGVPCLAYSFVKKGLRRIDKEKMKKEKLSPGRYLKDLKEGKDIFVEGKKYKAKDLTFKENDLKISYLSDTRENSKIIPFVKDSNLLISECTFMDSFEKEAKVKGHLTSNQVAKIAKKANVKKLAIIHVASRHEKSFKEILQEVKKGFKNAIMPRDLDKIEI